MLEVEFLSLIELSDSFKKLSLDIDNKSVKQSYLFVSRDKVSLRLLACLFASNALFDENGGDRDDIKNAVMSYSHADVTMIGNNEKNTVLTQDIEELIESAYFKPSKGNKRFFIIDNGETMNASCQNKLLKTLEEPPSTAHIIILSSNASNMLPTVVSRCNRIDIKPLKEQDILSALRASYPKNVGLEVAAAASGGSIDAALKLVSGRRGMSLFSLALEALENLQNSKGVLNATYKMTGIKEYANDFIDFNEMIFRDLLMLHEGKEQLCQLNMFQEKLSILKEMFSHYAVIHILPLFIKARQRLKFHGNINSIADEMYFSMAQLKAVCT